MNNLSYTKIGIKKIVLFSAIVLMVISFSGSNVNASSEVGDINFHSIGDRDSLGFGTSISGPPNTCGELHVEYLYYSWNDQRSYQETEVFDSPTDSCWIHTDASGHANKDFYITPDHHITGYINIMLKGYILWEDSDTSPIGKVIKDNSAPQIEFTKQTFDTDGFEWTSTDANYGAGISTPKAFGTNIDPYIYFKDLTTGKYYNNLSESYDSESPVETKLAPSDVKMKADSSDFLFDESTYYYVNWKTTGPDESKHTVGHEYSWCVVMYDLSGNDTERCYNFPYPDICDEPHLVSGSVTPLSGNDGLTVQANSNYTGDYSNIMYDYGDGSNYTTSTTHQYTLDNPTVSQNYTVQSRAHDECNSDDLPGETIGTVEVLPTCTSGSFGSFDVNPPAQAWTNDDIPIEINAYDNCGDELPGNIEYTLHQDPGDANTEYSTGTQAVPYVLTLDTDGIYSLDLTRFLRSETFEYFNVDRTPPTGSMTATNLIIQTDDPTDLHQTISINMIDPLVNNAASGLSKFSQHPMLGGGGNSFSLISDNAKNFHINFRKSGGAAVVPIGYDKIECTGTIGTDTYNALWDTNVPSNISNISCDISGTNQDQTFDLSFDVAPAIAANQYNEVGYTLYFLNDAAGNASVDPIEGSFVINQVVAPVLTVAIKSPVDSSVFTSADTVNFYGEVVEPDCKTNCPSYDVLWETNGDANCLQPPFTTFLDPGDSIVQSSNVPASCTYTMSVTDTVSSETDSDSVTVTYTQPSITPGYIDTGWDLTLDNNPPEVDVQTNILNWQNEPYSLGGGIVDDGTYDSGIDDSNGIIISSVTRDNNNLTNCSIDNLSNDEYDATWDTTFVDPCALHSSDEDLKDEDHPLVEITGMDKVGNVGIDEVGLCYDTFKPYVSNSSPQDEQMVLDLSTPLSITITEPANSSVNPPPCTHNLRNITPADLEKNMFLYDITNGIISDPLPFTVTSETDYSSPNEVRTTIIVQPQDNLEKLRTYQLRVNSYWQGPNTSYVNDELLLKDLAGNPVEYDLTFNTLMPPDILRIEKTMDDMNIESNTDDERMVTLKLYSDLTSSLQSDIEPKPDDPYYLTDLLPPYFVLADDGTAHTYEIYDKDNNLINRGTIGIDTMMSTLDRPEKGIQLVWKFDDEVNHVVPWGGRLELSYPVKVTYSIL